MRKITFIGGRDSTFIDRIACGPGIFDSRVVLKETTHDHCDRGLLSSPRDLEFFCVPLIPFHEHLGALIRKNRYRNARDIYRLKKGAQ